MPIKKGNKYVMTEEEAKAELLARGYPLPKKSKKRKKSKGIPQALQQPQIQDYPISPPSRPGQGKGWWDEPVRHALASMGIQTVISGKTVLEDYGSVYLPSKKYRGQMNELTKKLKAKTLREIIVKANKNPELYEHIDDEIDMWLEEKVGHVRRKYESQRDRNQLRNGNFVVDEKEYAITRDFIHGLKDDTKTVEMKVEEMKSDLESAKNHGEKEFSDYAQKIKTKKSKQYKMKLQHKLDEIVMELNQKRADIQYGEEILKSLKKSEQNVDELFQKAIKE